LKRDKKERAGRLTETMKSNKLMKKGRVLLVKIWAFHLFCFYLIAQIYYDVSSVIHGHPNISYFDADYFFKEIPLKIAVSPLVGIIGYFDGIPGFIFIPILIMLIVIFFFTRNIFLSYVVGLIVSYLVPLLLFGYEKGYYVYYILIAITVFLSWLVFKKSYKNRDDYFIY
jgi:hypothetical protein